MRAYSDNEIKLLWHYVGQRAAQNKQSFSFFWIMGPIMILPVLAYEFAPLVIKAALIAFALLLNFSGITYRVTYMAEKKRRGGEYSWTPLAVFLLALHRGILDCYFSLVMYFVAISNHATFTGGQSQFFTPTVMTFLYLSAFIFALMWASINLYLVSQAESAVSIIHKYVRIDLMYGKYGIYITVLGVLALGYLLVTTLPSGDLGGLAFFIGSLIFLLRGVGISFFCLRLLTIGLQRSPFKSRLSKGLPFRIE
ncbi:MAG: hypothetical protein N2C13_06180 [Chloroflexota bacterium]